MKITSKQYAQTLYDFTDGQSQSEIEKSVADFARHIYKNRKLKLAEKIIEQFGKIYNKEKNIIEAEVVSRQKLDEAFVKKVKHYIKEKYQAKEVVLKNIIDESVKGGMIVKVGDEVIDNSVRERLNELKNILVNQH